MNNMNEPEAGVWDPGNQWRFDISQLANWRSWTNIPASWWDVGKSSFQQEAGQAGEIGDYLEVANGSGKLLTSKISGSPLTIKIIESKTSLTPTFAAFWNGSKSEHMVGYQTTLHFQFCQFSLFATLVLFQQENILLQSSHGNYLVVQVQAWLDSGLEVLDTDRADKTPEGVVFIPSSPC